MIDRENSDETYSLIFRSLKHPIRRKILRMLWDSELTFSQILEILSIDSGHLSYHLENLGDLVTHSQGGKYKLSSFGMAAVKLMGGVEEYKPSTASRSKSKVDTSIKLFSVFLTAVLLWSSFYSINFTTRTSGSFVRVPRQNPGMNFALASNQTFDYNVTIIYGGVALVATEPSGLRIVTDEPVNTMNEWKRYFLRFDFEFNTTYDIVLKIRDPSTTVISNAPLRGSNGSLGIAPGAYMPQSGTYEVEIQNAQTSWVYGNVSLEVMWEQFQRPLFYYGLVGVATVLLYPTTVFVSWFWMKKEKTVTVA